MKTFIVRYHQVGAYSHGYYHKSFEAENLQEARRAFEAWVDEKYLPYVWERGWEDGAEVPEEGGDYGAPRGCNGNDCPGTKFQKAIIAKNEAERKKWAAIK